MDETTYFGFAFGLNSAHLGRSYMLDELQTLLRYVDDPNAGRGDYAAAIVADNCLGKRSGQTRKVPLRRLTNLYGLDPAITLFRTLRYFWERDAAGQPLLALLCACARDPLLRSSAPFVLNLPPGAAAPRQEMEAFLAQSYPDRLSAATLQSTAQNLLATWTKAGHLRGKSNKVRAQAQATPGAAAYALYLAYLRGARAAMLFESPYAALLDCPPAQTVAQAKIAAGRGWITVKQIGDVIEVRFPALLTQPEKEWLHE